MTRANEKEKRKKMYFKFFYNLVPIWDYKLS